MIHFAGWLFSIAVLLVRPTHQELEFPIGKVGKRHTEFLLIIVLVGIPCDEKNNQEKKMPNTLMKAFQNHFI